MTTKEQWARLPPKPQDEPVTYECPKCGHEAYFANPISFGQVYCSACYFGRGEQVTMRVMA